MTYIIDILLFIVLVIFICSGPIIGLVMYFKFYHGKTKEEKKERKNANIVLGMQIYLAIYMGILGLLACSSGYCPLIWLSF